MLTLEEIERVWLWGRSGGYTAGHRIHLGSRCLWYDYTSVGTMIVVVEFSGKIGEFWLKEFGWQLKALAKAGIEDEKLTAYFLKQRLLGRKPVSDEHDIQIPSNEYNPYKQVNNYNWRIA